MGNISKDGGKVAIMYDRLMSLKYEYLMKLWLQKIK